MEEQEGQMELRPITGTFPKEDTKEIREIPAHEGFDEAWNDAIEQAKELWHEKGAPRVEIPVTVEYIARVDIWNPGGIGQYHVKITPTG
jgi:hypothetical protein